MNSNNRIAATLYSPKDIVFLRNISINTLHKGNDDHDDDDNNNNNNNNEVKELQKTAILATAHTHKHTHTHILRKVPM
jgi:hypothetical protein